MNNDPYPYQLTAEEQARASKPLPVADLGDFAISGAEISVQRVVARHVRIEVRLWPRLDSTTGTKPSILAVGNTVEVDDFVLDSPSVFRDLVRRVVMNALAHEVDEWLKIDGVRIDPHVAGT